MVLSQMNRTGIDFSQNKTGATTKASLANPQVDSKHDLTTHLSMISEVLNALFLTYVATEYHLATSTSSALIRKEAASWHRLLLRPHLLGTLLLLFIVNILDRVSGAANVANKLLEGFFHVPKILFVVLAYSVCLYLDCRRIQSNIQARDFVKVLAMTFIQVLPLYPLLAICISFGFLILINLFELFHWRLELLNMPIYYGTLYGPFSWIYFKVKSRFLEERTRLPTTAW